MKRTRFDTRLIQILSALAALAIIVGLAAIGVNRYLMRSQSAMIETALPAVQTTSRIGASAEVVGSLAAAFVEQADTGDDLGQITGALSRAVGELEAGAQRLSGLTPEGGAITTSGASGIVERMAQAGQARLELSARIDAAAAAAGRRGEALDAVIAAATDLARVRITAGIARLYSGAEDSRRAALDALADEYVFAFERLTEFGRLVDAMRLELQQVPGITTLGDLSRARTDLASRLEVAERRIAYLPTEAAQRDVRRLLDAQRTVLAGGGLLDLQRERILLRDAIASDSAALRDVIGRLTEEARAARDATQAAALARIADAERRAALMSAALLALVIVAVGLGAVLWLYARRQLVARLAALSQRIVAVARGDYGAPMPLSGQDEIGRMEKALNILRRRTMEAERLRDSLQDAVIARTGDVVAQMKEADAARDRAEEADRSKTEFLARMSHEIRTPLNGIIGMLSLLESETDDPGRLARVRTATASARDLLEITNDILGYASGEVRSGGEPIHFALRELVGQLGHQLQSLASDKGLESVVDLANPEPVILYGDLVKIRQIVGNLISNAVKYTRHGSVVLTVDHAAGAGDDEIVVSFAIADTGVGMTPETVARAFDAYSRTEDARRAGIEGLGLGLAISRKLTEALGGALDVESEPGVGSRFTLTVPLKRGDASRMEDAGAVLSAEPVCRDVLVIDDHAVNRMVARGYLERLGCRVTDAATGAAGLSAAREHPVDLVLIDMDLPDMTGAEVAAELGASESGPVLVALTAHLIEDTPFERARLGVARVLGKPISPHALIEALKLCNQEEPEMGETDVLQSLQADIEDIGPEITAQIVTEFLGDLRDATTRLEAADPDAQRKAAHRLKGAASNFRLNALCEALARIEAGKGAIDPSLVDAAKAEAERAETTLRDAARAARLQTEAGSTKR
ncbi:ATP-binding protein [Marivita sp. GX14005]|uniref:ATP-binding protein n=1 Tax=Marivita sp. GX14005 TaxID=2942276 RepID=UPI0020195F0B|nr:ATP-binding protein [Marivita sp. GX14005]MCL3882563.1 ATP-binding protein [Marivita sp. GX14005]